MVLAYPTGMAKAKSCERAVVLWRCGARFVVVQTSGRDCVMSSWIVLECEPYTSGADAVRKCIGVFDSEDAALDFLADARDDDPDTGNGWTCMRIFGLYGD